MQDVMTIFYNKRTGSIKELCGGVQDMAWFGDEQQDYEQIFECITVDYDNYVIQNFTDFEVEAGALKLKRNNIPERYL